jgi:hypothetical protein
VFSLYHSKWIAVKSLMSCFVQYIISVNITIFRVFFQSVPNEYVLGCNSYVMYLSSLDFSFRVTINSYKVLMLEEVYYTRRLIILLLYHLNLLL